MFNIGFFVAIKSTNTMVLYQNQYINYIKTLSFFSSTTVSVRRSTSSGTLTK